MGGRTGREVFPYQSVYFAMFPRGRHAPYRGARKLPARVLAARIDKRPSCRYARMFAGLTSARAFSVLLLVLLPVSPLPPGLGNVGLACLYFLQSTFHVRRARNPLLADRLGKYLVSDLGLVRPSPRDLEPSSASVRAEFSQNDLVRPARV